MPGFLFRALTKADSSIGSTWVGKTMDRMLSGTEKEDGGSKFVCSRTEREAVFDSIALEKVGSKASAERLQLDYDLGYNRLAGVPVEVLMRLYRDCTVDTTWYTTHGDVFFGPETVGAVKKEMGKASVDLVDVPGSTHADIYMRTEVWERMYRMITGSQGE
ncbi:hypothetical protein N7470_005820 [Penicillium chermesinum]|nr:hypothetical protein N7470_005820 [Penicillium chermesinum]